MGTTAEKLARVKETKTAIKAALVSKGAEVTDDTPFRDYAGLIRGLTADGSVDLDDLTVTPTGKTFTKYPGGDGYSSVTVKGDSNLTAENLPKGLTIYGVAGASPMLALPEQYREYVDYARANLYAGDYASLAVWESDGWIAVSFLMDDFEVLTYNPDTTELTAIGWHTCGYTKSTGAWTHNDCTTEASTGENYAKHIKFASRYITYNGQTLFPVAVGAVFEPVAWMLYGTPSESGKIGLRTDNGVVLYKGVVTLELPEVDTEKYKYVTMYAPFSATNAAKRVIFSTAPFYVKRGVMDDGSHSGWDIKHASEDCECITYVNRIEDPVDLNVWELRASDYDDLSADDEVMYYSHLQELMWANYDVPDEDGGVYLAASDPIPVSGIVDYINDIPIYGGI